MPSSPLGSTNGRTASGVTFHRRPWTANTVECRRACNSIIFFGQYARSTLSGVTSHHGPWTPHTSGVACHHHLWEAHTVERRRAWHASIALDGKHSRMPSGVEFHHLLWAVRTIDIVGRDIPSWPLDTTHDRTKLVVAYAIIALERQTRLNDVERGMPSSPLD